METLILNEENLNFQDVKIREIRVKCFVENKSKFMLATTKGNCYQLPGGHVEKDENFLLTVKREIFEECGIELDDDEIIDNFFQMQKIYKTVTGVTKLSQINYYYIKTNKLVDLKKTNLTDLEKCMEYKINFVSINEMEKLLKNNIQANKVEIYRVVSKETLQALNVFKKCFKK